jgi:hypothetical protein
MSEFNKIVFGKKTFSDLLEEIYDNITEGTESLGISEEERAQLMAEIEKIQENK